MRKTAILYQAELPPAKDGIQKPMKPGGYSDSGADIAFELSENGLEVVTPVADPGIENDLDWVFPDTKTGIQEALKKGANTFWLNTVLYKNHPIESFFDLEIQFVGQLPEQVDVYDDKFFTNQLLESNQLPIPDTQLITTGDWNNLSLHLEFPLVLKPLRGRGSQGVYLIRNKTELINRLKEIFSCGTYGNSVYVEEYLMGQEVTITVMPPGSYTIENRPQRFEKPWCLPAVRRFNHHNGIAPYNGLVAIMENSAVLTDEELHSEKIQKVSNHCIKAAELLKTKAPIRIDCRANRKGDYFLFDLNMKPNMTGPSRPHRKNQDSLILLAARKIGWNYFDLLINMMGQSWKTGR